MALNSYYLFDMDGTLTPKRQPMTEEFTKNFLEWAKTHDFSIVSGSDFAKIKEQIPNEILEQCDFIFACAGNHTIQILFDGNLEENISEIESSKQTETLINFLKFEANYSNWPGRKFNINIEKRHGVINFSTVGREAPTPIRNQYEEWDNHDGERKRICSYINERFSDFEASIGGQISIDIVLRGKDKRQVLDYLPLSTHCISFYGDKVNGGNDEALAKRIEELGCGFSYNVDSPEHLSSFLFKEFGIGVKENV